MLPSLATPRLLCCVANPTRADVWRLRLCGAQTAMYSFQNSPQYWEAADEFRPERFLPQPDGSSAAGASNPAFAPFGDVRRPR
jgi:Cytochrome P450